jgi:hypothetical protein
MVVLLVEVVAAFEIDLYRWIWRLGCWIYDKIQGKRMQQKSGTVTPTDAQSTDGIIHFTNEEKL